MKAEKTNGSSPPVGKASDSAPSAPNAGSATSAPPRRSPASITATPASARKRPATGLPQTVSTASPAASTRTPSLEGEQCPQADRDPQREGEAAGEQDRRRARAEPKGRKAGAVAVPMTGEGAEQPGSRHSGQGANQPRSERGSERREEDAVAGQVVAPVPVVVPEQEAVRGEQVGAKRLRRDDRRWRAPGSGTRSRGRRPRACGGLAYGGGRSDRHSGPGRELRPLLERGAGLLRELRRDRLGIPGGGPAPVPGAAARPGTRLGERAPRRLSQVSSLGDAASRPRSWSARA